MDKDIIVNALYGRIKAGQMTIEQIPEAYQADVQALIDADNKES
jgi:hypothetical protein